MAWQDTSLLMLRTMLNDAGCGNTKYSDDRLMELLITSAYLLPLEVNFSTTYTINIVNQSISPDPESQTDGQDLISFMVLKSACLTDEANFRNAALSAGVVARCGPAVLQTTGYGKELATLLNEGPCKAFKEIKDQYNMSMAGRQVIRAVMTPFVSNDFSTWYNGNGGYLSNLDDRGR